MDDYFELQRAHIIATTPVGLTANCIHDSYSLCIYLICDVTLYSHYVTESVRIQHVGTKYTKLYFVNIFSYNCGIPFL